MGHLVKDCRNKETKDAWLAKREKRQSHRGDDDDSSRGRKHERQPRERSDSSDDSRGKSQERDRGRSSSRKRSNGRDRPNDRDFKKKKKTSQKWMSSDGEDLSDGDDSADGFMVGGEVEEIEDEHEEVEGDRVARALQTGAALDLVGIDSGCNRVILLDADVISEYIAAIKSFLRTAQAEARLKIEGRGKIGDCSVLHIPGATANLMSTKSIVINQCQVILGYDSDDNVFWREINCLKGEAYGMEVKTIEARGFNDLW